MAGLPLATFPVSDVAIPKRKTSLSSSTGTCSTGIASEDDEQMLTESSEQCQRSLRLKKKKNSIYNGNHGEKEIVFGSSSTASSDALDLDAQSVIQAIVHRCSFLVGQSSPHLADHEQGVADEGGRSRCGSGDDCKAAITALDEAKPQVEVVNASDALVSSTPAAPAEIWTPAVKSRFQNWLTSNFATLNYDVLKIVDELCPDHKVSAGYPRRYIFKSSTKVKRVRVATYATQPGLQQRVKPSTTRTTTASSTVPPDPPATNDRDTRTSNATPELLDFWDNVDQSGEDFVEEFLDCHLNIYVERSNSAVWFEFLLDGVIEQSAGMFEWKSRKERPLGYSNRDIHFVREEDLQPSSSSVEEPPAVVAEIDISVVNDSRISLTACSPDIDIEFGVALGYADEVSRPRKFRITMANEDNRRQLVHVLETLRGFPFGAPGDVFPDYWDNSIWTRRDEFCRILMADEIKAIYRKRLLAACGAGPTDGESFADENDHMNMMVEEDADYVDEEMLNRFNTYEAILAHHKFLEVIRSDVDEFEFYACVPGVQR
eukprot:g4216.t1